MSEMYSVRGKRIKARNITEQSKVRHGKRGRPMKHATDLARSKRKVHMESQDLEFDVSMKEYEVQSTLSKFEQLPNELIQQIFFYCFEISLPKASIHLAQALSTELTYRILILFAYFDDDGMYPVETKLFLPATYRPLDVTEKMRLQRNILSCRWFTLERVQNCLPALSWLVMVQAWYFERVAEELYLENMRGVISDTDIEIGLNSLKDPALLPQLDDVDAMTRHFSAMEGSWRLSKSSARTEPRAQYSPRITPWHYSRSNRVLKEPGTNCSVLAARVLPAWLLRGNPWTQEKLALLQLLRRGLQDVGSDQALELSAPDVFEGMADAIRTKHVTALTTLLELHDFAVSYRKRRSRVLEEISDKHYLPLRLFHLAATADTESSKIMWLLMRGDIHSLPADDAILTGWALRRQIEGDEVAEIMLKHMTGTADYQIPYTIDPFMCGCGSVESQLIEEDFRDELNYFHGRYKYYWLRSGTVSWYI